MSETVYNYQMFGKRKQLYIWLFVIILSLICITINSELSFLYAFHEVEDVQCFITVARCMLRGDVLYKDIYEHKGPMHFFLYYLGLKSSGGSTIGVYVIEILLFALFLLMVYKSVHIFCRYDLLNYILTAAIGVWASCRRAFCAGGECEELTLPFVTIALYLVLKENAGELQDHKTEDAEKKSCKCTEIWCNAAIIGLCFSIVFWSKYTVTGVFVGYVFAVIIIGITLKSMKYVLERAGGFIIGALSGSIPVILYFTKHRAFNDLWEVYFYNLIFKYSQNGYGETSFWHNTKSMMHFWIIVATFGIIIAPYKVIKKEGKIYTLLMILLLILGLATSKVWSYVYEALVPIGIVCIIGFIGVIGKIYSIEKARVLIQRIWSKTKLRLSNEIQTMPRLKRYINTIFVEKKVVASVVFLAAILFYSGYFAINVNPHADSIGAHPEDYEMVRISKLVREIKADNPVIISFTSLDTGIYYLTDTYPPDKYFCQYNLFSLYDLEYYEKYIESRKADFVISHEQVDNMIEYGYDLCYKNESAKSVNKGFGMTIMNYYLYARKELCESGGE